MASEQWLLNDTSVASGAYFTAAGATYKLKNTTGVTKNRVTSSPTPIEGSGCYASDPNNNRFIFETSASVNFTGTNYIDFYVYFASAITGNVNALIATGNDTVFEYSWANVLANGAMEFSSFDVTFGTRSWVTTSSGVFPDNEWVRVQVFSNANGVNTFRLFKGLNLNGTSPDTTITKNFNGLFSAYEFLVIGQNNNGDANTFFFDSIKFDSAAYPTRSTAYTADATGTETATGTGSLTYTANASASSSITATGTAAATKTVSIDASATITATGTAAASSTQALAATSSITGTGTAAASTTSPIAITATSSITASGTAALNLTYSATASSSITATGTAVLLQGLKVGATSTITASAAGAVGILATASTVTALASSPSVARINPNETRVSRA